MTKSEFDTWMSVNYVTLAKKLRTKYPKAKEHIETDFADFYEHLLPKLSDIDNPKGYLYQFIYNRHYRFTKFNSKVTYVAEVPETLDETDNRHELLNAVSAAVDQLSLEYKTLYKLYYVDKLSGRAIGKKIGISHTGVHKLIKNLHQIIEKEICLHNFYSD